jgi:hypothetical protein
MTDRSDMDRILQVWMADGPAAIPDRVVDVVAARIAVNHQRRRAWPFQGRTNVTTQIKLIAGLAAALVVAVVGFNLLPGLIGPGNPTDAPTASATPAVAPTAAPTAAPTVAAVWPTWFTLEAIRDANGAGILSAGSHSMQRFNPGFTYIAPEGWVNSHDEPDFFDLFPDTPANAAFWEASDGDFAQHIFGGPHASPWFSCESAEDNIGLTAADKVAAMLAAEVLTVSGVTDVNIGGLTGKQFDVRRNPDWTGTCEGDSSLPEGVDPLDERTRGLLLDVPGRGVYVIFIYSISSAEHDAFLAEAMPIVESFEFDSGG